MVNCPVGRMLALGSGGSWFKIQGWHFFSLNIFQLMFEIMASNCYKICFHIFLGSKDLIMLLKHASPRKGTAVQRVGPLALGYRGSWFNPS